MPEPRAVVFDLDDTLYPRTRFVLSGFRAVAARLECDWALPADQVFSALKSALVHGARGRELQAACVRFKLPSSLVPALVDVIRKHDPSLRLPASSAHVLQALRPGWRLGILTNGLPSVQGRKIAALGLEQCVDAVVFASTCGTGTGKPAPEGFAEVLTRLDVRPGRAVFVGDDPEADMVGASRAGLRTIRLLPRGSLSADQHGEGDAVVSSLAGVPSVAADLVPLEEYVDVA